MSGSENPLSQVATRSLFENPDVRVWEMDVGPGETCALHHHSNDYVLYITSGAALKVDDKDQGEYTFAGRERSVYYIPAGGTESFRNVSQTPFREALIEIKRPARSGQSSGSFTICEALVGMQGASGGVCVLENDRMRVVETTLAPGQRVPMARADHDAAVFVVDPGKVKIVERASAGAERTLEEARHTRDVRWERGGVEREIVNVGSGRYRQVRVEIK